MFEDGMAPFHPRYWDVGYGSSGTLRTLADVIEKNALGDGQLSVKNLLILRDLLLEAGRISKLDLIGVRPERASVVLGGLAVLLGLSQELGFKSLFAVEAGLRMGVLWDLYLRQRKRDRRQDSVKRFMKRFGVDETRASRAASNARALYAQSAPNGTLERMIGWAGKLHEVGMVVSHTGFHKHGAYLALNADLPGFTSHEQHLLSVLLLAQKGNLRKVQDAVADIEIVRAIVALRLGILFMHARIDPAVAPVRLSVRSRIELTLGQSLTLHHPTLAYWLSKETTTWAEVGHQFVVRNSR
jgi:exopolyphosphatase/guanosine-5'-triphosphate,3'-diphosphate pyrophosphatase